MMGGYAPFPVCLTRIAREWYKIRLLERLDDLWGFVGSSRRSPVTSLTSVAETAGIALNTRRARAVLSRTLRLVGNLYIMLEYSPAAAPARGDNCFRDI